MLKYVENTTSLESVDSLAGNEGSEIIASCPGSLATDWLVIRNWGRFYFGRKHKPRKYIIIYERYLNTWSSDIVALETDNEKTVDKYIDIIEKTNNELDA